MLQRCKDYPKLQIRIAVFENAMHSQLMEYFTSHKLLSNQQYRFRPNRSTELATLELMDRNINVKHLFRSFKSF